MAELKFKTAQNRTFLMVRSTDHITGCTGLTITITIGKDGHALMPIGGSVSEMGNGFYNIALLPSDVDTLGDLAFHCDGGIGADPQDFIDQVVQRPSFVNLIPPVLIGLNQYANRSVAQWYFNQRLHTEAWDDASPSDQDKALTQSTNLIENLNFAGQKASLTQVLQFPRKSCGSYPPDPFNGYGGYGITIPPVVDTVIPQAIINACCEIALVLLDDVDVNQEMKNVNAQEHKFSTVMTKRDTAVPPEWLLAGIPSPMAWNLLKPFLRDHRQIQLERVS